MGTPIVNEGTSSNRYTIIGRLAGGGMADIYIAKVTTEGGVERYVVLKRVLDTRARDPAFARMFLDEARLAALLQHPNIAQVHDVGKLAGSYFFTMEYVHGEDVRMLMYRLATLKRPLPVQHALHIAVGALAALHHAHERKGADGQSLGVVHRDVSPSNVMVAYDGTVKLLDFGVAKATQRTAESHAGTIKGKIAYLSPEQCEGREIDRRSDIFSVGILLFELLTGRRLYKRDSDYKSMTAIVGEAPPAPSSRRPEVSAALDEIVLKALMKDPAARFATAADMLDALETLAETERLTLSATSMGRFMRELFGERKEPWIELPVPTQDESLTVTGKSLTSGDAVPTAVQPDAGFEAQLAAAPTLGRLTLPEVSPSPIPGTTPVAGVPVRETPPLGVIVEPRPSPAVSPLITAPPPPEVPKPVVPRTVTPPAGLATRAASASIPAPPKLPSLPGGLSLRPTVPAPAAKPVLAPPPAAAESKATQPLPVTDVKPAKPAPPATTQPLPVTDVKPAKPTATPPKGVPAPVDDGPSTTTSSSSRTSASHRILKPPPASSTQQHKAVVLIPPVEPKTMVDAQPVEDADPFSAVPEVRSPFTEDSQTQLDDQPSQRRAATEIGTGPARSPARHEREDDADTMPPSLQITDPLARALDAMPVGLSTGDDAGAVVPPAKIAKGDEPPEANDFVSTATWSRSQKPGALTQGWDIVDAPEDSGEAKRAKSEPSRAKSDPSRAKSDPSRATSEPSRATSEPSRAKSEPSRAKSDPSQATSEPNRAKSDPSRAKSDPSRATSADDAPARAASASDGAPRATSASEDAARAILALESDEAASASERRASSSEADIDDSAATIARRATSATEAIDDEEVQRRAHSQRRLLIFVGGGVALVMAILIGVVASGRKSRRTTPPRSTQAAVVHDASVVSVTPDASIASTPPVVVPDAAVAGARDASVALAPDAAVTATAPVDAAVTVAPRPDAAVETRVSIADAATAGEWAVVLAACGKPGVSASDHASCAIAACNLKKRPLAVQYARRAPKADQAEIKRACQEHGISLAPAPKRPIGPAIDPCEANPLKCQK